MAVLILQTTWVCYHSSTRSPPSSAVLGVNNSHDLNLPPGNDGIQQKPSRSEQRLSLKGTHSWYAVPHPPKNQAVFHLHFWRSRTTTTNELKQKQDI